VSKSSGGALGINACTSAFPGIILAQKYFLDGSSACANPRTVPEGGANVVLGKAAERCENTVLGAALEVEWASGNAADGFM